MRTSLFRTTLFSAATVAALLAVTSAQADVVLAPGATWEYTFTNPTGDASWNTTTGTAGWTLGPAPFGNTVGGDFGAATSWPAGTHLWVRIAVDLSGYDLSSIAYDLGVDNGFALYANGHLIGADNAEGFTSRWEYTGSGFGSYLYSGGNVFAVELEDHGGATAFDMQLRGERGSGVPDGGSTLAMVGLVAVGVIAARRKLGLRA